MVFRCVTASSLFDGHDAAINVFRRLLLHAGCEVIHLGHNRSVEEIVATALQEDADAICVSSYQGGHMEFFRYMIDQLKENDASHILIFGGGGGTILPQEIEELQKEGVTRLYHAEDGRRMGLDGIVADIIERMEKFKKSGSPAPKYEDKLARGITLLERGETLSEEVGAGGSVTTVVGVTGPGGAGKSSLIDELITRYLYTHNEGRVGVLAFDPTKRKTGGALLGDRIRMNSVYNPRVFLRSMATRESEVEMGKAVGDVLKLMKRSGFDLIFLETSGIGQGNAAIVDICDVSLYVMTSEYGASTQLEKIDMIDLADMIVINKFDKIGSEDALEDVRYVYANSHGLSTAKSEKLPVFGSIASNFNDKGVTKLFAEMMKQVGKEVSAEQIDAIENAQVFTIIPTNRTNYLGEITEVVREYDKETEEKSAVATTFYQCESLKDEAEDHPAAADFFEDKITQCQKALGDEDRDRITQYFALREAFQQEEFAYEVRDEVIRRRLYTQSISGSTIPKIATPIYEDWGDILRFMREENFPGYFPFTAGVFPLKQEEEESKRQFAGEGAPERTNQRFHYLCQEDKARRLSTAFDAVTIYGEDPDTRLDVYGKVGNSGVSVATLDHMKALYKGFDLADLRTSVSLTVNGPAPAILAMFFNTAVDGEVEKLTGKTWDEIPREEYEGIRDCVLQVVRGTVQADILKEEQAQNTCIFSSAFALKMMGDIQEYFVKKKVYNFYSVSISGYHIAEAGANPITQLALTLSNGFTLLEYYLSRGMLIDQVAPSFSFFLSAGMDPEHSVLGRVARRIWAIAIKNKYGGNTRSQKLKYHVQTSGRSLHAQEIAFNDIRTTLQALMATYDHCNSLHTNAFDEAVTIPTEESVRRAMAIQMILSKEFGMTNCENPMQGSFFYEELSDLVQEAVLQEFEAISRRGGVLGAMEKQYQRRRIQTESMRYETRKASGELPIVGVNTFVGKDDAVDYSKIKVVRASDEEKRNQIATTRAFIHRAGPKNQEALEKLRHVALSGGNIFEELMETVRYASLGQITHLLYTCGGEYRRSM